MTGFSLVDEIYEAAVLPERWPRVLDRLAQIADAEGTLLFSVAPGEPSWLCSDAIRESILQWISSPHYPNNPRGARLVPINEPRFLTDLDAFTLEELEREDYYTKFLRPRGLGWCVGTSIRSPAGDALVFSIEKSFAKGPVPRAVAEHLDEFRPHLARASLLSARIGLERARAAVDSFEMLGLPALVLNARGRALATNAAMDGFSEAVCLGAHNQVRLADSSAQALLTQMLERKDAAAGWSIPVPGDASHVPFVVHILPLRGAARDVFSGAKSVLYITPVRGQKPPAGELLEALFDLTPAEARIAGLIAEGQTVDAITSTLSVSANTVRTHLKSIFAKTGVSRQAELVTLLSESALRTPSRKLSD